MSLLPNYPIRFVARATIEFETPFIVGNGGDDLFFDDGFVADANGLPVLPGSSLAGILRHAWEDAGFGSAASLFGDQSVDHGSRLSVVWGCIHDAKDCPVEGIILDRSKLLTDPVLAEALLLTARDHVKINHRGVADDKGKFDERSVSAGHRFTFELCLEGTDVDQENWGRLLSLLKSEAIRIGGKTRRGYGQFKVVSLRGDRFDLSSREDFRRFSAHPVSLAQPCLLPNLLDNIQPPKVAGVVTATLHLEPEAFWMIGGGFDPEVDMAPLMANRITWKQGKGHVQANQVVIPGSAVKGTIAHRVAFHYNRLVGRFATPDTDTASICGAENEAVKSLFGFCKGQGKEGQQRSGQRGRVLIGDLFVQKPEIQKHVNHVAIDRFTGGAREGALFDEKPFYGGPGFTLQITVVEPEAIDEACTRQALAAALQDLAGGRLAIGAGAGRGNGYFRAAAGVQWDEAGKAWLKGGAQ